MKDKRVIVIKSSLLPANAILFGLVIAKLMGWISWSWPWVLFPIWLPIAITVGAFSIFAAIVVGSSIVAGIVYLLSSLIK